MDLGWVAGALAIASALACASGAAEEQRSSQERPAWILIEAEDYVAHLPDDPNLLRTHDLPWASARTALIRFPRAEEVHWQLDASPGRRDLWIRYAATRSIALAWNVEDGPRTVTELPGTGALEGRGAWGWARLGAVDVLERGLRLSVEGAGLRPDCFALVPEGSGEPDWPSAPPLPDYPDTVLKRLAEIPPRAEAPWLTASADIELPDWIERSRVGLHTRLSAAWIGKPLFHVAESAAAGLGAPALVRHVKSMSGLCYWPSRIGAVHPSVEAEAGPDLVRAMVRRADQANLAFVAYYRHQEDLPLADTHPDWVCRDVQGRTIRTAGEPRLCFHSPFAEATLDRLLELVERGVDGIYLDESHQPLEGCWCPWTRKAFLAETGLPLPGSASPNDPLYRRFVAFTEDSLARELWRWREQVRQHDPDAVLLVSTHAQPDPAEPRPTLRLASIADVVKTEYAIASRPALWHFLERLPERERPARDALMTQGWAASRDGAFGRPAHVWIHGLEGAARWRAAAAAVVVSGCVANLDHPEASLPDAASFAAAIELARELARPLAGARPVPAVLLHLPERAHNELLPDRLAAWQATRAPFLAAWEALLSQHLPARILGDDQLEGDLPPGAELLFLPCPERLGDRQRATVERFRASGGLVVESEVDRLSSAARSLELPVRLELPDRVQAHWLRASDGAWILGLTNAPAWVTDPRAPAPPEVAPARIELADNVELVQLWPGERSLEILEQGGTREVQLPAFQEAVVLRLRTEPNSSDGSHRPR